ncbi:serine hydrolase [Flavobacterium sp. H122]|uniref:serine hydrolase domain-containing protein n=1 Tax=Flavobacterium sp. H122 TaxID=2529860 RepID=UPI0010AA60BF|nr:serine hydrolase domain-containing protein [Flavobacterium sp. H122]
MKYLLLLFLSSTISFSQISFEKVNQKTKKLIENYKTKEDLPGVAVSVSYNDTILFSEGFGYADLENRIKVEPSKTKFDIGSVTKTITICSLARLAELDSIKFEESIYKYLPELPHKGYDFTIAQLGAHLSGLQRDSSEEIFEPTCKLNKNNFFEYYKKDNQIYKPQTKYMYSNLGYKILGLVLEKKSGLEIEKCNKKLIFDILKLTNTHKDSIEFSDSSVSKLYLFERKNYNTLKGYSCEFKYGEGCFLSTSEDLIKFGNALLFPEKLLKKETLVYLIKNQKTTDGKNTDYGIGFSSRKDANGNYYYGHEGNWIGSRAFMYIYPKSKLVITLLANRMMNSKKYNHIQIVPEVAKKYIDFLGRKTN